MNSKTISDQACRSSNDFAVHDFVNNHVRDEEPVIGF